MLCPDATGAVSSVRETVEGDLVTLKGGLKIKTAASVYFIANGVYKEWVGNCCWQVKESIGLRGSGFLKPTEAALILIGVKGLVGIGSAIKNALKNHKLLQNFAGKLEAVAEKLGNAATVIRGGAAPQLAF